MENNDEKNIFEKTISKQNDSSINLNNIDLEHNANINTKMNDIKIDKDKKELLINLTPKINEKTSQKDNLLNSNKNDIFPNLNSNEVDLIHQVKTEEYRNYKEKKAKLYNFYQTLLNFRQKLIIKEKQLNQREKNLIEFEKILKANESILQNNIEQFETYMRNKLLEIKNQFCQIEKLQQNKEQYLKKIEEEINLENNYINNSLPNKNIYKCENCNLPFNINEELNKQYIINTDMYCDFCNNYMKNIINKEEANNNIKLNFEKSEQNPLELNLNNKSSDFNYKCTCPGCKYCNI